MSQRILSYILGRDPEDAKKLFDLAYADLIDTLQVRAGNLNGHKNGMARDIGVLEGQIRANKSRINEGEAK